VLTSAVFVAVTVLLLARAYDGFDSEELPAPRPTGWRWRSSSG
jgi:hypothetical protein